MKKGIASLRSRNLGGTFWVIFAISEGFGRGWIFWAIKVTLKPMATRITT